LVPTVESLYLNEHELRDALQPFSRVQGEALNIMAASERAQESTLTLKSFLTVNVRHEAALRGKEISLAPLVEQVRNWQDEKIIFVAPTKGDAVRLSEILDAHELSFPLVDEPVRALLSRTDIPRAVVTGHLTQGFRLMDERLVFVSFDEIFGTRKRQPTAAGAKSHPSHFLTSLS
jgi:transcription-repair coupling factor (superfamily II helicase)